MKRGKITVMAISLGLILGISLYIHPLYAWEKQEMDRALREELNTINDVEERRAVLEEYKEVLKEQMPELDIEEATCQACEYDLDKLVKENIDNPTVDQAIFLKDNAGATRVSETVTASTPESVPEVVTPPPPPPPPPAPKPSCGC